MTLCCLSNLFIPPSREPLPCHFFWEFVICHPAEARGVAPIVGHKTRCVSMKLQSRATQNKKRQGSRETCRYSSLGRIWGGHCLSHREYGDLRISRSRSGDSLQKKHGRHGDARAGTPGMTLGWERRVFLLRSIILAKVRFAREDAANLRRERNTQDVANWDEKRSEGKKSPFSWRTS